MTKLHLLEQKLSEQVLDRTEQKSVRGGDDKRPPLFPPGKTPPGAGTQGGTIDMPVYWGS